MLARCLDISRTGERATCNLMVVLPLPLLPNMTYVVCISTMIDDGVSRQMHRHSHVETASAIQL